LGVKETGPQVLKKLGVKVLIFGEVLKKDVKVTKSRRKHPKEGVKVAKSVRKQFL